MVLSISIIDSGRFENYNCNVKELLRQDDLRGPASAQSHELLCSAICNHSMETLCTYDLE